MKTMTEHLEEMTKLKRIIEICLKIYVIMAWGVGWYGIIYHISPAVVVIDVITMAALLFGLSTYKELERIQKALVIEIGKTEEKASTYVTR